MLTPTQQQTIIDGVRALTHGLPKKDKQERQHVLFIGICLALNAQDPDLLPPTWYLSTMNQRVEKILR